MSRNDQAERNGEQDRQERRSRFWGLLPKVEPSVRREVLGSLFVTGPELTPYLFRFSVLLGLSIAIASFGILSDSAAVVIGAMLIAPLMTPVLGVAAATVMGWERRLTTSVLQVAVASAGAIGLAWLCAFIVPDDRFALVLPEQLLARTEPTALDLAIAIAAGAAGAYVLIHKQAVAALPGVAVAVALVPPLAVVGVSLELGNGDDAGGALLLYGTNLAGIILAAMVVFVLTGFIPEFVLRRMFRRIRVGFVVALASVLVVSVPLMINSVQIVTDARDRTSIAHEVQEWLGEDSPLEVVDLDVEADEVTVDLVGPEEPPPPAALADRLDKEKVTVRWTDRVENSVELTQR